MTKRKKQLTAYEKFLAFLGVPCNRFGKPFSFLPRGPWPRQKPECIAWLHAVYAKAGQSNEKALKSAQRVYSVISQRKPSAVKLLAEFMALLACVDKIREVKLKKSA